jgi:hypothetical protein
MTEAAGVRHTMPWAHLVNVRGQPRRTEWLKILLIVQASVRTHRFRVN